MHAWCFVIRLNAMHPAYLHRTRMYHFVDYLRHRDRSTMLPDLTGHCCEELKKLLTVKGT